MTSALRVLTIDEDALIDVPRGRVGPSSILWKARRALSALNSLPRNVRPRLRAITAVVPEPVKGSRTMSPGLLAQRTTRSR